MFKYLKILFFSLPVFLVSCHTTINKPLLIDFSADSSTIVISDINEEGMLNLKKGLNTDTMYQKIVSVLQTPAEDDSTSMEVEWPGKLTIQDNKLVFTPDSAFRKGKHYLVETILNSGFATTEDILKSDVGHQVKLNQKLLKR